MSHRIRGIRVVAGVLGSAVLFVMSTPSAGAAPHVFRGSWSQVVKASDSSQDDMSKTVRALQDTGQDVIVYPINTSSELADFKELLYEVGVARTTIRVFASVGSWTTSCAESLWLDTGDLPGTDCDCNSYSTTTDRLACKNAWLRSWKSAAAEASKLSASDSHLKGFVIDDFDNLVESADEPACYQGNRLTLGEVKEIADAVHRYNAHFEFWPTAYYTNLGRVVGKGYMLGANYGVKLRPQYGSLAAEDMVVLLTFKMAAKPSVAELSFFHEDAVADCYAGLVAKEVYINAGSSPIWSETMAGDQGYEEFTRDVARHLKAGTNTIRLRLAPYEATNGCGSIWWRIWDVRLVWDNSQTISTFDEQYFVNPRVDAYAYTSACAGNHFDTDGTISNVEERCPGARLPDDQRTGRLARRMVAGPNAPFLIRNVISGIVAPTYSTQTAICEQGCEVETCPFSYDPGVYRDLLEATKRHLPDHGLFALHLGMGFGANELDTTALRGQLDIARQVADYVGVWNYPLGVRFLDSQEGVFAEHPSTSSKYSLMAYWPERQATLSGWFQRWTSNTSLVGKTIEIKVEDTFDGDGTGGILRKSVSCAGLAGGLWEEDVSDPAGIDTIGPFTVTADPLVISMELTGEVGNAFAETFFEVVEVTPSGEISLGRAAFDYESGVTEPDHEVIRPYEVIRDFFLPLP